MAGAQPESFGVSGNIAGAMADGKFPGATGVSGPAGSGAFPACDIHVMRPEEAEGVAQLMHDVYRDTYPKKFVYDPLQHRTKIARGEIVPVTATSPEGKVLGYVALTTAGAYPEIGNLGSLAVHPGCRGQGLGSRILRHLVSSSDTRGFYCLTGGAFTAHPYSQQAVRKLGFHTSAVLLASQPGEISFQGISENPGQRESMAFLTRVPRPEPYGLQYVPANHLGIILEIATELGICMVPSDCGVCGNEPTVAEQILNTETGTGIIVIRRIGPDHRKVLAGMTGELRSRGTQGLRLNVSLSDPGAPSIVSAAEEMGFIFAGILPAKDGVILLLQHLQGIPLDFEQVHMGSPFGKRLLAYIQAQIPANGTGSGQKIQIIRQEAYP